MYGDFRFTVVGTCTSDVEYSVLQSGTKRASVNIAVNVPEKKQDGTYEEKTTFVRIAFFGKAAERKSLEWCVKGSPVYVCGTVQSYAKELPTGKLTMYNFRPDLIRPMGGKGSGRAASSDLEDPMPPDDDLPD